MSIGRHHFISLPLALWSLSRLPSAQLPEIATEWLAQGLDTSSLRILAGINSPTMSEAGPLFEKALSELKLSPPLKEAALTYLARHYAQQIIDGTITPYEGASRIWWEVSNAMDEPSQLMLSFVGAASELEDLPDRTVQDGLDRKQYSVELEASIIASARELLKTV